MLYSALSIHLFIRNHVCSADKYAITSLSPPVQVIRRAYGTKFRHEEFRARSETRERFPREKVCPLESSRNAESRACEA